MWNERRKFSKKLIMCWKMKNLYDFIEIIFFEYVFSNLKKDKTKEIFEEIDWKKKKEEYI